MSIPHKRRGIDWSEALQGKAPYTFIRHWLVVAIFAHFNIALHRIDRRHPESQPCEN